MQTPPVVLTIAGFDPSSGAGVTADIKTIAAHDCYGVACVSAYTVQSTQGVRAVEAVRPELVRSTLEELAADVEITAVRIGMLGSAAVAEEVADFLSSHDLANVVLDPIVSSSSGANLLGDDRALLIVRSRLLPLSTVVTPNISEAEVLTGLRTASVEEMKAVGMRLREMGAPNVVVTGGHLEQPTDVLVCDSGVECLSGTHIESRSTHGTGCAFATALACSLALGRSVRDAVISSKQYVREAMERAYPVGKGIGPLNHFFRKH